MPDFYFDGSFNDWRRAAREALSLNCTPTTVEWRSSKDVQHPLFHGGVTQQLGSNSPVRISRGTLQLFESVACYRDPERWHLMYRVLWRMGNGEPYLMNDPLDRDVRRLMIMDKQIRREVHKMHAFVRFREIYQLGEEPRFVAWFEPAHDVVIRSAPFFARRFPAMQWSILTPDISIHWDCNFLNAGPGMARSDAPRGDDVEELWATYYANIFNPARLKTRAMLSEMPKRYWVNLPEAALISQLVREAAGSVSRFRFAKDKLPRKS